MEMYDMANTVGNMKDVMQMYNQLKQNPMQILTRRFNIPQNMDISNPNNIIQHLLNTGQITQEQVNQAMQMGNMIKR
jgi:hypothetical protein